MLLSHILIEHVDKATRKQWEIEAVSEGITDLDAVVKFLESKCQALELIHANQHPRNNNSSNVSKPTNHAYVATHTADVFHAEANIPCADASSLGKQAHSKG